jgi:hypothetical protein
MPGHFVCSLLGMDSPMSAMGAVSRKSSSSVRPPHRGAWAKENIVAETAYIPLGVATRAG